MKTKEDLKGSGSDTKLVLGYLASKDLNSIREKALLLERLGYSNKEIAIICDTSENMVSTEKSVAKKGGTRKK